MNICSHSFWDNNITWHTDNPDFTQCFQETIFVALPCMVFALIGIVKWSINCKRPSFPNSPWTLLRVLKIVLCVILILIKAGEISIFAYRKSSDENLDESSNIIILGSSCEVVCYVVILFLLRQDMRLGIRLSSFHILFWFVFSICSAVKYRSLLSKAFAHENHFFVPGDSYILSVVYVSVVICQCFLNFFDDPKDTSFKEKSFFKSASIFSLITFFWFQRYIYKATKSPLTINDFQPITKDLKTEFLWSKFKKKWENALKHRSNVTLPNEDKVPTFTLLWVLMKSTWKYFFYGCLCQIIYDFLLFSPIYFLDKIIVFMSNDEYMWRGYFYGSSLFMCSVVGQIFYNFSWFFCDLLAIQIKSITMTAIYKKVLNLSNSARCQYTSGEIVNLMSVDIERLYLFAQCSSLALGSFIKTTMTMIILWQYLGPSCLSGVGVLLVMLIYGFIISRKVKTVQEKQMTVKDTRLKNMSEILNGIKILKLYAWEIPFMDRISEIRRKEINLLKLYQLFNSASGFLWDCSPLLVAITSLATFVMTDEKNILTASIVFVCMNLLNILRRCIFDIPQHASRAIQVIVSMKRIAKFLTSDEYNFGLVGCNCDNGDAISMRNGTFAWTAKDKPVLSDINLHIPCGSVVAITGPVGSGKSSLLSAILGEMIQMTGSVDIKGRVAYVPQQAWILNETVRQNILFVNSEQNKPKYNEILGKCCLKPDLRILPGGDKTEIGEKGINLSGGQKQRVSLARAVFHNSDIYLLDDPLSAVDSHVGKDIFEHVISKNGLLGNKTRILTTHKISILPYVDFIITLKDGRIEEMGSYHELVEKNGVFANFIQEHATQNEDDESRLQASENFTPDNQPVNNRTLERSSSINSRDSVKIIDEENMEIGKVKRSVFINYIKHLSITLFFGTVLGCALGEALEIGSNIWLSEWTTDPLLPDGTQDEKMRNFRIAIYATFGISQAAVTAICSICLVYGCTRAARIYHAEMLQSIMRAPMSFFDTTPIGRILNRFSSDIDDVDMKIGPYLGSFLLNLMKILGMIVVVGSSTPFFLLALIPVGVIYYLITKYFMITYRQLMRLYSTSKSPIYSLLTETLNGTLSIRAYNADHYFSERFMCKLDQHVTYNLYVRACTRWIKFNLTFMGNILVFIAAILAVRSRGILGASDAGLSITYALSIIEILTWIVFYASQLESYGISVERIEEYSNLPSEAPWDIEETFSENWPTKGSIQFNDYSTQYREGLNLVIKNMNISIKESEKIGVVGRTGAGKSSMTLALFRIIEPVDGTILIDNVDISKIGLHQLRSKLTIIPQDPILFTGSLRFNLDPNNECSDDQLWLSLENANLKTFIASQSAKLNFEVAEGGENLSVGQRQLLCLARALLKNTNILILDEATAAVDMNTDQLIQDTIRTKFKNHTVITIAHRLNTIMDYDKILVVDSGEVVEFGPPQELLRQRDSVFYKLAEDAEIV